MPFRTLRFVWRHIQMVSIEVLDDCKPSGIFYGGRAGKKVGVLIDGQPWILKFPRPGRELSGKHVPSYTSSPVAEWLGSHIYESLGIPAHETRLGYREGRVVCACRDFTWPDSRLFEFSQIKTAMNDEQDGFASPPSDGSALYLSDVLATISQVPVLRETSGVIERFWDMFVVDALIKNPDRNNGNWGLLLDGNGTYSLAPVYDCGSALFAKRTDSVTAGRMADENAPEEDAFSNNLSCYLLEGADGNPHRIRPFEYLSETNDPDALAAVKRIAERLDLDEIDELIDSLPREFRGRKVMGAEAAESHKTLLRKRFNEGILPVASRQKEAEGPVSARQALAGLGEVRISQRAMGRRNPGLDAER